jgi:endoglucanase
MTAAGDLSVDSIRFAALDGPTGAEGVVADALSAALAPLVDRVERDALGNVIAHRRARNGNATGAGVTTAVGPDVVAAPRLLIVAPLDEPSMIVARIDPGGFLRFRPIGPAAGIDVRAWLGQPVTVHGRRPLAGAIGTRPPHVLELAVRDVTPEIDVLFVDVGLCEADVRAAVAIGDAVTLRRPPERMAGGRLTGKAAAGGSLLAALVEIARRLAGAPHPCDVVLAGTAQGAFGHRGAAALGGSLAADSSDAARTLAVVLGTASAGQRGVDSTITLGAGPTIVRGPNVHPRLYGALVATAKRHEIPVQLEAAPGMTRTSASVLQVAGAGIACAVVQVPARYGGTAVETVAEVDVARLARLVAAFAAGLDGEFVAALLPAVIAAGSAAADVRATGNVTS